MYFRHQQPQCYAADNAIFSSTYQNVAWSGEVIAETVDTGTGAGAHHRMVGTSGSGCNGV